MKSITIHNIDGQTEKLLHERAKKEGISLNKLIKKLLRQSLGLEEKIIDNKEDFKEFFGSWSEEDYQEFNNNVKVFSELD